MIKKLYKQCLERLKRHQIYNKHGLATKYYFPDSYADIGEYTYVIPCVRRYDDTAKLKIGKFCSIADDVRIILGGNHFINHASCFSFYEVPNFKDVWERLHIPRSRYHGDVLIGNDVWIGRHAIILSGANIGDGAVVGAGAVVAGQIPPYAIAVGNPIKIIGYRFPPTICEKMLKIKWWDWSEYKVKENLAMICSDNLEDFVSKFYNETFFGS